MTKISIKNPVSTRNIIKPSNYFNYKCQKSITKRKAINNLIIGELLKGLTKDRKKPHRLLGFSLKFFNNEPLTKNHSGKQDHFKLKLKRLPYEFALTALTKNNWNITRTRSFKWIKSSYHLLIHLGSYGGISQSQILKPFEE